MYLLIDNYDSFTYNLYSIFSSLGAKVKVIKNNEFIEADDYKGIILSPGPSSPENSGTTLTYIEKYKGKIPIFGVCLGMQSIGYMTGLKIRKAMKIMHGKLDNINVNRESMLFNSLPESFKAVRYHSLVLDADSNNIDVTSTSKSDNEIMSIENERDMLFGVQFHPESILSEHGEKICSNFLNYCKEISENKKKVKAMPMLLKIGQGSDLSFSESKDLFNLMADEKLTDAEVGAVLMGLKVKGETAEEIYGAVSVLQKRKIKFEKGNVRAVDTCGTGGDGKSCMNVSTAVSIILAASGENVIKHGNRAMSGKTGSADILERFNVKLDKSTEENKEFFNEHHFAFLFAQNYHPILKPIGKIRKQLKIPTLFNLIGPLLNPAEPEIQIIGVGNSHYLERLADVALKLKRECIILYSSEDGYDEVSTECLTNCIEIKNSKLKKFQINPEDYFKPFPMPKVNTEDEAELMFLRALSNGDPKLTHLLSINSALAFKACGRVDSFRDGFELAKEIIVSGKAYKKLKSLEE